MSDERYISEIEDRLREAGAPPTPPAHLHAIARAEALGPPDVVDIRSVVRPSSRVGRLVLAAAVLTASAAAALVIGVGGSGFHVDRSVHLQGAVASASAVVDVGSSVGPVRDVQVHVNGLPPAPKGGYYELWMQDGSSEPTGLVAFDTSGTGSVVANTTIPKDMPWTKCWVTLERADGSRTTVLTLA
jgi:Anti-sigma-K factor rskA